MRRFLLLVSSIFALALIGCGNGSSLPEPTGKGGIRAINAIPTSPAIEFLIEERPLGNVNYKTSSTSALYDDLDYIFNFAVLFPDNILRDRVASQPLTVVADMAYTFLISGDLASPQIDIWEKELRVWLATETVFSMQFGHAAESLGNVDVYFSAPGVAPALGEQRGTLSFTEALPPIELEAEPYVLTLTVAGDPSMVLFTSNSLSLASQTSFLLSVFDGDGNDTSPWSVRVFDATGSSSRIPDANFSPTIQFVQASMALETSDIYDEPTPSTPIVTDHAYTNVTTDIAVPAGLSTLTYTAAGNVSSVLFEDNVNAPGGVHERYTVMGADSQSLFAVEYIPDRHAEETIAKFTFMNAASNHLIVDAYLVEGELDITDLIPRLFNVDFGTLPVPVRLDAGSYDLYVTTAGEKTILAGPTPVDAALGDIIDVMVLDTVDPATAQVLFIPSP
jgi:hypothetical protein